MNRSAQVRTATLLAPAHAERLAGDFHHIHQAGDLTVVIVGDVTGKGAEAAPYAEQARAWAAECAPGIGDDPAALLETLNARVRAAEGFPLVAAAAVTIDARLWSATWAYAGHLPPVALDTGLPLDGANPGMLLGLDKDCQVSNAQRRPVRPGEGFALYTDGLEDAVGPAGRFGTARVTHTLARQLYGAGPEEVVQGLKRAVCRFAGDDLYDDVCIAALRLR